MLKLFTLTIRLDPNAEALLTRILNALERQDQARVDTLTARTQNLTATLESSRVALAQAQSKGIPNG